MGHSELRILAEKFKRPYYPSLKWRDIREKNDKIAPKKMTRVIFDQFFKKFEGGGFLLFLQKI
jgi:hypothetical protein